MKKSITKSAAYDETAELRETEKTKLVSWLRENIGQSISRRDVAQILGKEIGNATRCCSDLFDAGILEHSHVAQCPVTGKRVEYLKLAAALQKAEPDEKRCETQKTEVKQLELFP